MFHRFLGVRDGNCAITSCERGMFQNYKTSIPWCICRDPAAGELEIALTWMIGGCRCFKPDTEVSTSLVAYFKQCILRLKENSVLVAG